MNSTQLKAIEAEISRCLDTDFSIDDCTDIHGGDINQSFRISSRNQLFFLKSNRIGHLPLLKSEARSLTEISRSGAIKVPSPICCGQTDSMVFLLLEFLDLSASRRNSAALGQALADMHRQSSEHFGWPENNFIGHTPQQNPRKTDWVDFWRTDRLGFQAELAAKNHCPGKTLDLIERVRQVTAEFFKNYQPAPA
ncbi:MAG: fructosamine kinase family protein, partial [Gammaproteobacteria bacterium]|nr:fructosamine kinase family protein [Gammaproteobacteria bacterium]